MPANSQTGLYFEVAVNPSPEQVGEILPLTRTLTFTATDAVVGKEFNLTRAGLTNVLPRGDRGASAGAHDDLVIAVALAVWRARRSESKSIWGTRDLGL